MARLENDLWQPFVKSARPAKPNYWKMNIPQQAEKAVGLHVPSIHEKLKAHAFI
jgi:hypothetical protein